MHDPVLFLQMSKSEFLDNLRQVVAEVIEEKITDKSEDKLLSPREAMKLFFPPISRTTLHNHTKSGVIPSHRIGGKVLYKQSDILAATKAIKRYKPTV